MVVAEVRLMCAAAAASLRAAVSVAGRNVTCDSNWRLGTTAFPAKLAVL